MLIYDLNVIGNRLYALRKRMGMTQTELAEAAGLSDRAYADIERGSVNMRIETVLKICEALHITPDEILTEDSSSLTSKPSVLSPVISEALSQALTLHPKVKTTAFIFFSWQLPPTRLYFLSFQEQTQATNTCL